MVKMESEDKLKEIDIVKTIVLMTLLNLKILILIIF